MAKFIGGPLGGSGTGDCIEAGGECMRTLLTLYELQQKVREMYEARGFASDPAVLALGVSEEAGEVARAILLTTCTERGDFHPSPKKLSPEWDDARDVASEVGDLITYCLALCNALGIEPLFKWHERGWSWKVEA